MLHGFLKWNKLLQKLVEHLFSWQFIFKIKTHVLQSTRHTLILYFVFLDYIKGKTLKLIPKEMYW